MPLVEDVNAILQGAEGGSAEGLGALVSLAALGGVG